MSRSKIAPRTSKSGATDASRIDKRVFYNIKNYFAQKYHGRYFAILLRELAQNEPTSFASLIEILGRRSKSPSYWRVVSTVLRKKQLTVQKEYPFLGASKKRRRADLALMSIETPLRVLFEIKEYDGKAAGNAEQLNDYLREVSRLPNTGFVYVSRFELDSGEREKLAKRNNEGAPVVAIRYREIYDVLQKAQSKKEGVLARMVCEYLEDIGVGIYRIIDLKIEKSNLAFLLTQMLGFPEKHGMGRLESKNTISAVPDLFSKLFGNLEVMGEWIRLDNQDLIKSRFKRKFQIEPHFDFAALKKELELAGGREKKPKALSSHIGKYVGAGKVYFYAVGTISSGSGAWLGVTFGYGLYLKKGSKNVSPYLYTHFDGGGLTADSTWAQTEYLTRFPNEASAQSKFSKLLKISLKKAQRDAVGPIQTVLAKFKLP